jgi:hypothetical protein
VFFACGPFQFATPMVRQPLSGLSVQLCCDLTGETETMIS